MSAFGFLMWISYAPPNPLTPQWTTSEQLSFRQFLPEGWAFFTKNQRDPLYLIFAKSTNGEWQSASLGPQSQLRWAWGVSRISRAQGLDVGLINTEIPRSAFSTCRSASVIDCLSHLPRERMVSDNSPHPLICGPTVIAWRKPVPWSWAKFRRVTLKTRLAYINVRCGL